MKTLTVFFVALAVLAADGCGRDSSPATAPPAEAPASTGAQNAAMPPGSAAAPAIAQPNAPASTPPASSTEPRAATAAPAPGSVAVARPGQPISNKAIELRVIGMSTAAVGNRPAAAGRAFAIVETAWKSLVPPRKVNRKKVQDRTGGMASLGFGGGATAKDKAADEADTTLEPVPFEIGPMTSHVWLIVDGRDAEAIAADATLRTDGHLPTGTLKIPAFEQVVSGAFVFDVPADARALSLLLLDSANGHLLVPITGEPPRLGSHVEGESRSNELVELAVAGTSWMDAPPAMAGMKFLVVSVRGVSRQAAIAQIPFGGFSFVQTASGCMAQPEARVPQIRKPLAPTGAFLPLIASEGQLAFAVPADTESAMLLVRLRQGGSIDLPVLGDGRARKPPSLATHEDGAVLRVHVVGTSAPPAGLVRPKPGFEPLVVDYVIENLKAGIGLELQLAPQFALADGQGAKYAPDRASQQLPCRVTGANVVPAGGWRRFSLLYVVPEGQSLTLQYRGFESSGSLKVR